jgi:hypothetical protein
LQTVNANAKKMNIFKHFTKSKKLFFPNIYHSPFDPEIKFKKSIKLKPPGAQPQARWSWRVFAHNFNSIRFMLVPCAISLSGCAVVIVMVLKTQGQLFEH